MSDSVKTAGVSKTFRRLALATVILIYVLINVGGIVRVTHSGLGCPDWPLCYGQIVPLEGDGLTTLIEFSHRLVAGITGLFMLATAIMAWKDHRHNRRIVTFSTLAVVVLPLQFVLGGIVVYSELEPLTVLIHLGTALIIFASSLVVSVETYRPQGIEADSGLAPNYLRILWIAVLAVFVLVIFGALVVGTGASLACRDWPLCYDQVLPVEYMDQTGTFLHVAHRYIAGAIGLFLLWMVWYSRRHRAVMPGMANWSLIMLGVFAAQIAIGGVKIWSGEATVMRALHLGAAAAVWAVLVIMLTLATFKRQSQPVEAPASTPTTGQTAAPAR